MLRQLSLCCGLLLIAAIAARADCLRQISLSCNDLAFDPVTGKIYASIPGSVPQIGNSLVSIDPETGKIGPAVFIGSEPGKLAISDVGGILWVALDGAGSIRRYDTASATPGVQFGLGTGYGPYTVGDMAAMPGRPETIAVAKYDRGTSSEAGVVIYDNGVPRPKAGPGITSIEFSDKPTRLYGYEYRTSAYTFARWTVDDTGIISEDDSILFYGSQEFVAEGGRVYTTGGGVFDPEAQQQLGTLPGGLMRPDSSLGQVFILQEGDRSSRLLGYDLNTFRPLWAITIPGAQGGLGSLIRWGGDGLAFRTGQGQVYLIHTGEAAAVAAFTLTLDSDNITGGSPATGTITLGAPAPAGGATLTLTAANPGLVTVPATVTVPAGKLTATFPVITRFVGRATPVDIAATDCVVTQRATVTLQPALAPPSPGNLLLNGSFELPDVSASPDGGLLFGPGTLPGQMSFGEALPGWSIVGGTIHLYAGFWMPEDGRQSVDLNGGSPGSIEQTVPTEPGREYHITGWMAHNPTNLFLPEGRANVYVNHVFLTQLVHRDTSATQGTMHWTHFDVTFHAIATSATLTFSDATGSPFPGGLALDGLGVTAGAPPVPPVPDPAPAPPTHLTAQAVSPTQVDLTWTDNSNNETAFAVWRQSPGGPGSSDWTRIAVVAPNVTRYSDTGLTPNTTYIYRVRATNDSGASSWTDEVSVHTPAGP
jgi:hypothetical protein